MRLSMKRRHPIILLLALIAVSVLTSFRSYRAAEHRVASDMNRALALSLQEQQSDVISQDTIRRFNDHLLIADLRGKATIVVDAQERQFKAYARCSQATIFSLSDQRGAAILWMLTAVWAMFCFYRSRQQEAPQLAGVLQYGGLSYAAAEGTFHDASGQRIRLTPMQQQLLEMFFRKDTHLLSKTEICDALWPKKPDASDTLYTLIRRLKPIVEQHSDLKIESDRGRAYELKIK